MYNINSYDERIFLSVPSRDVAVGESNEVR